MKNDDIIAELLQESSLQQALRDFNLTDIPEEAQAEFIRMLGENIQQRIMVEIAIALPETARPEYEQFIGAGDLEGLRVFLASHIPNIEELIVAHAKEEYDATVRRLREIERE